MFTTCTTCKRWERPAESLRVSKLPGGICSKSVSKHKVIKKPVGIKHWVWKREHVEEWLWLKSSLTKEPVLKFYHQDKPLKVSTDASKSGLGAALLQQHDTEWYPVGIQSDNPYQHFKDELSVLDGVLLKGTNIVVPMSMRKQMLNLAHEGHLGMEKCKRWAREVLYWPGKHRDIVTLVQQCEVCQRHRYQQPKEPMKSHDKPVEPWRKVGMGLFQLKDTDYLLLMDYHPNYPEFMRMSNTTAEQMVVQTKAIFC